MWIQVFSSTATSLRSERAVRVEWEMACTEPSAARMCRCGSSSAVGTARGRMVCPGKVLTQGAHTGGQEPGARRRPGPQRPAVLTAPPAARLLREQTRGPRGRSLRVSRAPGGGRREPWESECTGAWLLPWGGLPSLTWRPPRRGDDLTLPIPELMASEELTLGRPRCRKRSAPFLGTRDVSATSLLNIS